MVRLTMNVKERNEQAVRAAIGRLLSGTLPPGGKCSLKTVATAAGVSRTAFYPKRNRDRTTRPGPDQHLAEEADRRLKALQETGPITDPGPRRSNGSGPRSPSSRNGSRNGTGPGRTHRVQNPHRLPAPSPARGDRALAGTGHRLPVNRSATAPYASCRWTVSPLIGGLRHDQACDGGCSRTHCPGQLPGACEPRGALHQMPAVAVPRGGAAEPGGEDRRLAVPAVAGMETARTWRRFSRRVFHSDVCCSVRTRSCRSRSSRGGKPTVRVPSRNVVHWAADRLGRLPVRQAEWELPHTNGGWLGGRETWTPVPRVPVDEVLVAPQPIQPVAHPYRRRAARFARPCDLRSQRRDLLTGTRAEGQRAPRQLHRSTELPRACPLPSCAANRPLSRTERRSTTARARPPSWHDLSPCAYAVQGR